MANSQQTKRELVKAQLMQYLDAAAEYQYYLNCLAELEKLQAKVPQNGNIDILPGGPTNIETPALFMERIRLTKLRVTESRERVRQKMNQVDTLISSIPDARARVVLRQRYIDGEKWETIAEKNRKSRQWAVSIHKKALDYICACEK